MGRPRRLQIDDAVYRVSNRCIEGMAFMVPTDDASKRDAFAEIMTLPCVADVVRHPDQWPGANSWHLHQNGGAMRRKRENRNEYWRLKQAQPEMSDREARERATVTHTLRLADPYFFSGGTADARRESACALVERRVQEFASGRCGSSPRPDAIKRWNPRRRPPGCRPMRRRPVVIAATSTRLQTFAERMALANLQYDGARSALRRGLPDSQFPHGMIPLHKTRAVGTED